MVAQFRSPGLAMAQRAGMKDARALTRQAAYDPRFQADQAQLRVLQEGEGISLTQALANAANSVANLSRLQVEYTGFFYSGTVTDPAGHLLIPRNANRTSFYFSVSGTSAPQVYFSYGHATASNNGLLITAFNPYAENSGLVGIDDIYCWPAVPGATIVVSGWEGVPSL